MLALFDDLEQQAEGLQLAERDAQVAELGQGEYAELPWAARLHGSTGRPVRVRLLGGRVLEGDLQRVGADFFVLAGPRVDWVVCGDAVAAVAGLADRAVDERARSVLARLTVRSMLRRLAESHAECLVLLRDDTQLAGRLGRVGRDFVELRAGGERVDVVPLGALAAVQEQP